MKWSTVILLGTLGLLAIVQENSGTLMLSSILMALKSGYWAGKIGMGGLFAMMAAKNYEQQRAAGSSPGFKFSSLFTPLPQSTSQSLTRKRIRFARSLPVNNVISQPTILLSGMPQIQNASQTNFTNSHQVKGSSPIEHVNVNTNMTEADRLRAKSLNRVVRQLGILERLSCLPKLLCGLETKEPSTKTTALNDYGALVKLLFGREDDHELDDDDDNEDDQNDDDNGRASVGSTETEKDESKKADNSFVLRHTVALHNDKKQKNNKYKVTKNRDRKPNKDKNKSEDDDSDESGADDEKDEKSTEDYTEFDQIGNGALSWKEMAQDDLLSDEPELLAYALMELREELKEKKEAMENERDPNYKKKNEGRDSQDKTKFKSGSGSGQNSASRNSTRRRTSIKKTHGKKRPNISPDQLKYQVISPSTKIQSPYDPYPIQYPESYVPPSAPIHNRNIIDKLNKNIREKFGFGFHSDRPQGGTVLETLLPSSIYQKFKTYMEDDYDIPPHKSSLGPPGNIGILSSSKNNHFPPNYPYLRFSREMKNSQEDGTDENSPQRTNSKFRRIDNDEDLQGFMNRQAKQLENNGDPLNKYRVALETGHRTKSARQCRLLFSRCPYRYSEIKQLIDNAKEFLESTATVGDKVVPLKKKKVPGLNKEQSKNKLGGGQLNSDSIIQLLGAAAAANKNTQSKTTTSQQASTAGVGMGGLSTFVMQQLPNGDFEIKLKVKPKQEVVEIETTGGKPVLVTPIEKIEDNIKVVNKNINKTNGTIVDDVAPGIPVKLNSTLDDIWGDVEVTLKNPSNQTKTNGNDTNEPVADKAFAPTKQRHDLLGIDYPPEPLAIPSSVNANVGQSSLLRREMMEDEDVESKSESNEQKVNIKMRPPSHHLLPPRPAPYKIVRRRMGRPQKRNEMESREE